MPPQPKTPPHQMCTCGHLKHQHKLGNSLLDPHGGKCTLCDCKQYTWAYFCDEHGNRPLPPA